MPSINKSVTPSLLRIVGDILTRACALYLVVRALGMAYIFCLHFYCRTPLRTHQAACHDGLEGIDH